MPWSRRHTRPRCRRRRGYQGLQVGAPGSGPGLSFFALVSEDGGRLGVEALRFVDLLASHAGTSVGERRAFVTFSLQRLRCATVKGARALINNRSPLESNPEEGAAACCPSASPDPARRLPSRVPRRPHKRPSRRGSARSSQPRPCSKGWGPGLNHRTCPVPLKALRPLPAQLLAIPQPIPHLLQQSQCALPLPDVSGLYVICVY